MPKETVNNKELIPLEHYLNEFRNADPAEMSTRSGVPYSPVTPDAGVFHLVFLERSYRIDWPEFAVTPEFDPDQTFDPLTSSNQARILVLRYLLEGSSLPATGAYLTYREVPWGEVYYRQFTGRCLSRLAFSYGSRLDAYRKGMEILGAAPLDTSDAGYAVCVFPGYIVQFLLWEGDEDFPPSAQILFSDNFAAAFHAEDLVVVSEIVISSLKAALQKFA